MNMAKVSLCGLTADEILELIEPSGFSSRHSVQISNSIYKKRITSIQQIAGIPKSLNQKLANIAVTGLFPPDASVVSTDGSVKYLFRTEEGKVFETVFIPEIKRNTVCVSTQSGCRMGCSFCSTAKYGYSGNLTASEIINQIISIPHPAEITHVVFMGMGEPMDNLENVLKACRIITSEWGMAISPKNITVSTVGIVPEVEQFLLRSECNLTLSYFSPFAIEREKVVPNERLNPANRIVEIMKNNPGKKKRRLSIAYIMVENINDTDDHLEGLKMILKDSVIRVNLLSYHPLPNDSNCSSSTERMQYFKHNLVVSGISASIRRSRGTDISAACGLLAARVLSIET
jgi:23S rRNA (adenine2503-C2)-methyltransferase